MDAPITVAGGGVGGLTAALAFAAAGRPCTVLERRPAPAPGGFRHPAAAQREPASCPAWARPRPGQGVAPPGAREIRRWSDGALLGRIPFSEARHGAPYLTLRRADLLDTLFRALAPGRSGFGVAVDGSFARRACSSARRPALVGPNATVARRVALHRVHGLPGAAAARPDWARRSSRCGWAPAGTWSRIRFPRS